MFESLKRSRMMRNAIQTLKHSNPQTFLYLLHDQAKC